MKQIVSMATGVPVSDFSGGKGPQQANQYVRERGFKVTKFRSRNPNWTRDELILALDIYLRHRDPPLGKTSDEIVQLSDLLNELGLQLGLIRGDQFRNPNGVYMKLMNFRHFDPAYTDEGKVGLQRGGKEEETIWREFANDPDRCHQVAVQIQETVSSGELSASDPGDSNGDDADAEEGQVVTRLHRTRERNRKLVRRRKEQALRDKGRLNCEACGFDFERVYGERGAGFIECHHTKPITELKAGEKTRLGDLALLCANCHRMVHTKRPWLTMDQLLSLKAAADEGNSAAG